MFELVKNLTLCNLFITWTSYWEVTCMFWQPSQREEKFSRVVLVHIQNLVTPEAAFETCKKVGGPRVDFETFSLCERCLFLQLKIFFKNLITSSSQKMKQRSNLREYFANFLRKNHQNRSWRMSWLSSEKKNSFHSLIRPGCNVNQLIPIQL